MRRIHAALIVVLGFLLLSNGWLLLTPVDAATCETDCPGGNSCWCSGSLCTQNDGEGCATFDGNGNMTSSCSCGRRQTF